MEATIVYWDIVLIRVVGIMEKMMDTTKGYIQGLYSSYITTYYTGVTLRV